MQAPEKMVLRSSQLSLQPDLMRTSSMLFLSLIVASVTGLAQAWPAYRAGSLTRQEPQPIYSADPQDAWNRTFYLLFTRTVKLRLANNFKEGAPFTLLRSMSASTERVSAGIFERIESGDRAIDPLYPSFFNSAGVESVLIDPQYQQFKQALQDALAEPAARPPLSRALMQADAWAAFDILRRPWGLSADLRSRRDELLPMLALFIRKLALTPEEIGALPHTYAAAQHRQALPAVFDERSGWIEVEWFPDREHDRSADYRRAVRVFVKPRAKPHEFLDNLNHLLQTNPGLSPDPTGIVHAVALVTEDLLIDSNARVEPSPLTIEVQLRTFVKDHQGNYQRTTIAEYELSRKLLLSDPSSGGLVRGGPEEPAYLPIAGNDYTFASPMPGERSLGAPVLTSLRRRCEGCHGEGSGEFFTFAQAAPPKPWRPPLVRQLRSGDDPHARYVAQRKMKEGDFKSLCWSR